jgi:hypothetical protein
MNQYQPQSTQRPQRFFWVKTKNTNYSMEKDSFLPFDPPGKKEEDEGRGGGERSDRSLKIHRLY